MVNDACAACARNGTVENLEAVCRVDKTNSVTPSAVSTKVEPFESLLLAVAVWVVAVWVWVWVWVWFWFWVCVCVWFWFWFWFWVCVWVFEENR